MFFSFHISTYLFQCVFFIPMITINNNSFLIDNSVYVYKIFQKKKTSDVTYFKFSSFCLKITLIKHKISGKLWRHHVANCSIKLSRNIENSDMSDMFLRGSQEETSKKELQRNLQNVSVASKRNREQSIVSEGNSRTEPSKYVN